MKNIFYILLLLPTIIFAQYQGNANQKITLGEQTTADGLVYRGVASIDTVTATSKITRANKQDTSAYLLLDTVTNLLWHYKIGSNAWTQAGGGVSVSSFSAGTTGLTPSTATTGAVTLGGTLAVANGGTGVNMSSLPNNYLIRKNASGFFDTSGISSTNGNIGINTSASPVKLTVTDNINLPTTGIGTINGANVWIVGANSLSNNLVFDAFNGVNAITVRRSNGTSLSPTNITNGNSIFQFLGRGYGSTGYSASSRVAFSFAADEDFTDTNQGTRIAFSTTNNGTTTQSEKMRITNAGNVGIGTASPSEKLHVVGNGLFTGSVVVASTVKIHKGLANDDQSIAIGELSLNSTTTGIRNTAFGQYALQNMKTGQRNLAFGQFVEQKDTSGSFNTGIGWATLPNNLSGSNNMALGYLALYENINGSSNTAIGYQAAGQLTNSNTTGNNNTFIGNEAVGESPTTSNHITLGNSSITKLRCQVALTTFSDGRDKTDILPLNYGMNFIDKLKPVSFIWDMRDGGKIGIPEIGFIAQDLQQAQIDLGINIPNLVSGTEEKLDVTYNTLLPIIVKALQEANNKIKSLEQRLLILENK